MGTERLESCSRIVGNAVVAKFVMVLELFVTIFLLSRLL
jgi:hypothetical protein